jgi:hypothetical protein
MQSDYERKKTWVLQTPLHLNFDNPFHLFLQVYTLGTILSMQISFVGFQPVQSSEHMAVSL